MNTAFPLCHSFRQRRAACRGSGLDLSGLDNLIGWTLGLRYERSVREHLGALWRRVGISADPIEDTDKPATKFVNPGEGVSFTAFVLNCCLLARPQF